MGKTLLKNVVLAKINVFIKIDFPYNDICLAHIFCIWFSIFLKLFCQLRRIVSCKSSENVYLGFQYIGIVLYLDTCFMFLYIGSLVRVY